jgi:hypothetical protein
MNAAPQPMDAARLERALDRLHEHTMLVGRMTADGGRRAAVRIRLEHELGPELTRLLITGLSSRL